MTPTFDYQAFISYRRAEALLLATWLRRRLKNFRLPSKVVDQLSKEKQDLYKRGPRIWLDRIYDRPSADFLTSKVYPALDRSARLIVISTPSVFDTMKDQKGQEQPNWLVREIDYFLENVANHGAERPVDLVLGPGADEHRFPGRLKERSRQDWVDLKAFKPWHVLGLSEKMDKGLQKLVAGLYQVPDEVLPDLFQEERRRRTKFLLAITSISIIVALFIAGLGAFAWHQRNLASENERLARKNEAIAIEQRNNAFRTQSLFLADLANQKIDSDDVVTGMLLALRGLPREYAPLDRPIIDETVLALRRGTARQSEKKVFRGYEASISKVAYSPDGKNILAGFLDGTVRLLDATTGDLIQTFSGHKMALSEVAFSPDGKTILSGFSDGTMEFWDSATGEQVRTFNVDARYILDVTLSADGKTILTGDANGMVGLWDAETGKEIRKFRAHWKTVLSVAFSRDGQFILTSSGGYIRGSKDNIARLWDAVTGDLVQTFSGHQGPVREVAFSPKGNTILTISDDRTIRLWDATTGETIRTLIGHEEPLTSVTFSPDGNSILTSSEDNTARLWDAATGSLIQTFKGHDDDVRAVAFSPDGKTVLTGSGRPPGAGPRSGARDNTLRLWDLLPGSEMRTLISHKEPYIYVRLVAFSPNGKFILTSSEDYSATRIPPPHGRTAHRERIWDAATGDLIRSLDGHEEWLKDAAISPDGATILTLSNDGLARLWDAMSDTVTRTLEGHGDAVTAVAFSPDGASTLTGSKDKTARTWNAATGDPVGIFAGHEGAVLAVAFSPDGKTVLTGSKDGSVLLWNAISGDAIRSFKDSQSSVISIGFSSDGSRIVAHDSNDAIWFWDAATGKLIRTLKIHKRWDESVAISPNGNTFLSYGSRGVCLGDSKTSEIIRTLKHDDRVYTAAFSSDGSRILTGSDDGTAKLWTYTPMKSVEDLVRIANERVPRRLTEDQEREFFLRAE